MDAAEFIDRCAQRLPGDEIGGAEDGIETWRSDDFKLKALSNDRLGFSKPTSKGYMNTETP